MIHHTLEIKNCMKRLTGLLFVLTLAHAGMAQSFKPEKLAVEWQLATNAYEGGFKALNQLTLTNTDKRSLPASGWVIYFSSARELLAAPAMGGLSCTHVNGDIYRIEPVAGFQGITPGKSVTTSYVSNGNSFNRSGAPSGMYLVWNDRPEKGWPLAPLQYGPFLDSTQHYKTPADIYAANAVYREPAAADLPPVFPTPAAYAYKEGSFTLDAKTAILSGAAFHNEAALLAAELKQITGKDPVIATAFIQATPAISLVEEAMEPEAYRLEVQPGQVTIAAGSRSGIFYGIQSLLTMIPGEAWSKPQPAVQLPAVSIKDKPRFGLRALMVDIGRNFQTKEEMKRLLDLMGLYKLNTLHLHFSEDEGWRIEIPGLPELTEIGARRGHPLDSKHNLPASFGAGPEPGKLPASGYYTRAEYIDILRYATARHIEVIPEIETPGHARASIKAMEARYEKYKNAGNMEEAERYRLADPDDRSVYSTAQAWTDNVICVARPSAYAFMEKVIDELIAMYSEAGALLTTIHMGGDEVPDGAWEQSPLCKALLEKDSTLGEINDLWYYYFDKVAEILRKRNLILSGWEEVGMRKTKLAGSKKLIVNPRLANEGFRLHVWNNMVGWGNEDLPYRLANAGYKVVLSPVSNNYFDMSYYKHPDEPGFYWGGFTDLDKPFYFIPYDYFKNTKENAVGEPVQPGAFIGKDLLTDFGKTNILGLEGLIWSETLRSADNLEYMVLPKLLGLAERAWAQDPAWAAEKDSATMRREYEKAWSVFATVTGKRELPRLSSYRGGFKYRVPAPGAVIANGQLYANMQLPGFTIRYTTNGKEPGAGSPVYTAPITEKGEIRLRAFDASGRGSRTVSVRQD